MKKFLLILIALALGAYLTWHYQPSFDINNTVAHILPTPTPKPVLIYQTIDPSTQDINIEFGTAQYLSDWKNNLGARNIINGSFFNESMQPAAIVYINSNQVSKNDLGDYFTAHFYKTTNGSYGIAKTLDEIDVEDSLQGYPLLIYQGEQVLESSLDQMRARSAIGIGNDGRVHFIVTNRTHITLLEFTEEILKLDLDLYSVLNLDGARSTGMISDEYELDNYDLVPVIIWSN